jgi:hypothetical protein
MADYYPLIARAVAGLENSTGEARRALYERARTALVAQLRGVVPALTESDITRERLALEESIRKVEAEAARRSRLDVQKPDPTPPRPGPPPPPPPRVEPKPAPPPSPAPSSFPGERSWNEPPRPDHDWNEPPAESVPEERQRYEPYADEPSYEPHPPEPPPRAEPVMPRRAAANRPTGDRTSLTDQGLKGFRDVVSETESLREAIAQASKVSRDPFGDFPARSPAAGRQDPQFEPDDLVPTEEMRPPPVEPRVDAARRRSEPPHARAALSDEGFDEPPRHARLGGGFGRMAWKVAIIAGVVLLCVLAAFAYRERAAIGGLYQAFRGPASQATRETGPTRGKIADRIGADGQQDSSSGRPGSGSAPLAAVAQRVVLYEQQPNSNERKQYIGSVIWRTESASPGPGLAPELAVKADVEIPERHLRMSWTMRRNTDQTLPASHTLEIIFTTAADFAPGGIADVPGVLMEQAEQTRGVPLTGLRVKVTNGFFLVGLSAVETEAQRNIQLLKERPWLDIPLVYNDGNRALLAIEKGVPGDRVFAEAFAAWKQ